MGAAADHHWHLRRRGLPLPGSGVDGVRGEVLVAAMLDSLVPIGIYTVLGDRAQRGLTAAKTWMVRRNRALGVAVFFGFSTLFAFRGLLALM